MQRLRNSQTIDLGKASTSATSDRLGYIGKENDIESAFGGFGVRKYDDTTCRFLSIDSLWEEQLAWSPYHYSYNNPINLSDPSGLNPLLLETPEVVLGLATLGVATFMF